MAVGRVPEEYSKGRGWEFTAEVTEETEER
jgi:hypothetical protein